eukprot:scaffold215298_cov27-Tisochrysis_lutea.AAC.2
MGREALGTTLCIEERSYSQRVQRAQAHKQRTLGGAVRGGATRYIPSQHCQQGGRRAVLR